MTTLRDTGYAYLHELYLWNLQLSDSDIKVGSLSFKRSTVGDFACLQALGQYVSQKAGVQRIEVLNCAIAEPHYGLLGNRLCSSTS